MLYYYMSSCVHLNMCWHRTTLPYNYSMLLLRSISNKKTCDRLDCFAIAVARINMALSPWSEALEPIPPTNSPRASRVAPLLSDDGLLWQSFVDAIEARPQVLTSTALSTSAQTAARGVHRRLPLDGDFVSPSTIAATDLMPTPKDLMAGHKLVQLPAVVHVERSSVQRQEHGQELQGEPAASDDGSSRVMLPRIPRSFSHAQLKHALVTEQSPEAPPSEGKQQVLGQPASQRDAVKKRMRGTIQAIIAQQKLSEATRERHQRKTIILTVDQVRKLLERSLPWLQALKFWEKQVLSHVAFRHQRSFDKFQLVYREDTGATAMHIVARGRVQLSSSTPLPASSVASRQRYVEEGGAFGEEALLSTAPRRATAVALEPTLLVSIPHLETVLSQGRQGDGAATALAARRRSRARIAQPPRAETRGHSRPPAETTGSSCNCSCACALGANRPSHGDLRESNSLPILPAEDGGSHSPAVSAAQEQGAHAAKGDERPKLAFGRMPKRAPRVSMAAIALRASAVAAAAKAEKEAREEEARAVAHAAAEAEAELIPVLSKGAREALISKVKALLVRARLFDEDREQRASCRRSSDGSASDAGNHGAGRRQTSEIEHAGAARLAVVRTQYEVSVAGRSTVQPIYALRTNYTDTTATAMAAPSEGAAVQESSHGASDRSQRDNVNEQKGTRSRTRGVDQMTASEFVVMTTALNRANRLRTRCEV